MIFIFVRVLQLPRLMTGTFGPCSLDSVLSKVELYFEVHKHNVPTSWSRKMLQVLKASVSVTPFDCWGYEFTTQLTTSTWTSDFLGNVTFEALKSHVST